LEFLRVNYFPFQKYSNLFSLSWSLHFYFIGIGFYIFAFYGILRFFVSRRLSILGVFALLSTWSFSKILQADFASSFSTTFSLIWIWSLMFCTKSSTYRAGFFIGLVNFLGALINLSFSVLLPVQLTLLYLFLMKDRTLWFRRQTMKYSILGSILTVMALVSHSEVTNITNALDLKSFTEQLLRFVEQKSFIGWHFLAFYCGSKS
jgi:hypothetical protein